MQLGKKSTTNALVEAIKTDEGIPDSVPQAAAVSHSSGGHMNASAAASANARSPSSNERY